MKIAAVLLVLLGLCSSNVLGDTAVYKDEFLGHADAVNSVAFSADGKLLASGSWDKTVQLWDTARGTAKQMLTGHTDVVTSVTFSRDGKTLASGSADGTVLLWRIAN